MKNSKNEINDKALKIMRDIEREYYEDHPFNITYQENLPCFTASEKRVVFQRAWLVVIDTADDQFGKGEDDPGHIIIIFDDDTGNPAVYADTSMGRPVPMNVKKDATGKSYLDR